MSSLESNYINDSYRKITKLGLDKSSAKLMPKGSIIMSSRAPIGYIAINTVEACTSQGCKSLVPYLIETNEFLLYVIKASITRIIEASKGTTFDEISGTKFGEILVPLAPLKEQFKICKLINDSYKTVNAISDDYTCVKDYISIAKRKILDSIFGPNSSYKSYYTNKKLSQISKVVFGQSPSGKDIFPYFSDKGTEFHQGKLSFGIKYLNNSKKYCTNPKKVTNGNSILMSVRAPVGDINLCNRVVCIGRGLCSIEPEPSIDIEYLFYYLLTQKNHLLSEATGSTFSAIKSNDVKNINVPICSLEIQGKIVLYIKQSFHLLDVISS